MMIAVYSRKSQTVADQSTVDKIKDHMFKMMNAAETATMLATHAAIVRTPLFRLVVLEAPFTTPKYKPRCHLSV